MKSVRLPDLIALAWVAATLYAYGVFTDAVTRPGFLVHLLKTLFATLKAGYLE